MKRINRFYLIISAAITILITAITPTNAVSEGILKYSYGFPLKYITIYQEEANTRWFLSNFFSINKGFQMDGFILGIDITLFYLLIIYSLIIFKKDL